MQFLVSMGDSTTRDYSGSFEWTRDLRAPSLCQQHDCREAYEIASLSHAIWIGGPTNVALRWTSSSWEANRRCLY
jgi:hypothetical protein